MPLSQISAPSCAPTTPNGVLPASSSGLSETALALGGNKTPYTENWDFLIDQRGPWKSLIDIGYTGSRSRNELIAGTLSNVNLTPRAPTSSPIR